MIHSLQFVRHRFTGRNCYRRITTVQNTQNNQEGRVQITARPVGTVHLLKILENKLKIKIVFDELRFWVKYLLSEYGEVW